MATEINTDPEICIVDDDIFYRNFLRSVLVLHKMNKVRTFSNGELVLNFMENNRPDYVVIDYEMPDMSGITVIRELKKMNINCCIIMISGSNEENLSKKAIEEGAHFFIKKTGNMHKTLLSILKSEYNIPITA